MTLKIETYRHRGVTTLRLIGRIRGEHVHELERLMLSSGGTVSLDLEEVTLVDADVIKFLGSCATRAIPLIRCPPFVAEWIAKERQDSDRPRRP